MTERRTVVSLHDHLVPLPHRETTGEVENGWGGVKPLPVAYFVDDLGRDVCNTAWKIPKSMHRQIAKAMRDDLLAISVLVVISEDGKVAEMSIIVPNVEVIKDQ